VFTVDPLSHGRERSLAPLATLAARGAAALSGGAPAAEVEGLPATRAVNGCELPAASLRRYGSKLCAVLRRLLRLPAGEKAIVVCGWGALLDAAARACAALRLGAVLLAGSPTARAEKVRAFTTSAAARVLLLHAATDCAGLTLVAANHLFLLDQQLHPGTLAQLVARIARQGQARQCFVYHVFSAPVDVATLRARERASAGARAEGGGVAAGGGGGGGGGEEEEEGGGGGALAAAASAPPEAAAEAIEIDGVMMAAHEVLALLTDAASLEP